MKTHNTIILLIVLISCNVFAQTTELVWKNIETRNIISHSIDDTFKVHIKLPDNYFTVQKTYPVLYMLDGDLTFPIALSTLQYLEYGDHIPQMIVVAIGYGSLDWQTGNNRSRDYTIISTPERPYQGGAQDFRMFIEEELIPGIEKEFRVDKNDRIIMGHSLGGQFVLYSFLTKPELFSKYIASSPFIYRVKDLLLKMLETNRVNIRSNSGKLFISVGGEESKIEYLTPINELAQKIMVAAENKDKITLKVFENGGHFSVPGQALTYGLISLFK